MSDKIIGIDGGKKVGEEKVLELIFTFHFKDGSTLEHKGMVLATNSLLPGFIQVIPVDPGESEMNLVASDCIKHIDTREA